MRLSDPLRPLISRRLRSTYRAVLRREPADSELLGRRLRSVVRGGWPRLLRDMIDSDEFRSMILPGLVVTGTEFHGPQPVFFLHIPKTGGTSVRLALGEALGVPSLNIYGAWPEPDRRAHHYWPYWAGHAQAAFFPESHVGFTLFREPRSRLLSTFRQHQFQRSTHRRPQGWNYPGEARRPREALAFPEWLADRQATRTLTIARFFLPADDSTAVGRRPSPTQQQLLDGPSDALARGLSQTLQRFRSAAWIHDNAAVSAAIAEVAGRAPGAIPRENVAEKNRPHLEPVVLDEQAMAAFDEVAALDEMVFKAAEAHGILPGLERETADRLFTETAQRLAYILPS